MCAILHPIPISAFYFSVFFPLSCANSISGNHHMDATQIRIIREHWLIQVKKNLFVAASYLILPRIMRWVTNKCLMQNSWFCDDLPEMADDNEILSRSRVMLPSLVPDIIWEFRICNCLLFALNRTVHTAHRTVFVHSSTWMFVKKRIWKRIKEPHHQPLYIHIYILLGSVEKKSFFC